MVTSDTSPLAATDLLEALNELLEAERAGARVARETAAQMHDRVADQALVIDIQHDEVRWCGMLMRVIKAMQGQPSDQTGAFHVKAMAITAMTERLTFLNRGQDWVVRRLQTLIPRISDSRVQAELQTMLDAHVLNIDRVMNTLQSPAPRTDVASQSGISRP